MFSDWKVLYTHPRAEKMAALDCKSLGLEYYLPLRSTTRVYQRRKVTFLKPLFPSYIFVCLPDSRRIELLSRGHIVHALKVLRPVRMLRQIVMVRKALRLDPGLEAVDAVAVGETVRIATGPMQGCEGVVSRISGKGAKLVLTISVDIIGKAVPVAIERGMIERIPGGSRKKIRRP